ncbi:MAG: ROK family protein, partial [Eubacteriaceae bacterium]|nr:ROK family protein [Eubacteriaceae bacterium]
MKYAIGIDIGGTNTRVALVDENLKMIDRIQFATPADDPAAAIARITESIQGFSVAPDALAGIGMSCPG